MIIGIDPGLSGAMVALTNDGSLVTYVSCPVVPVKKTRRVFLVRAMANDLRQTILECEKSEKVSVYIEQAGAMPKQGLSSTFLTGKGLGIWEGIVSAMDLRYELVRPRDWQKEMYRGIPGEKKERSLIAAARLFPDLPLTKPRGTKPTIDGRADAALIAMYGVRKERGESNHE